ncbi:MAG: hypothetical protein PUE80_06995, partial [bacterium]|nr:hypothetical protein [bacterium]
LKPLRGTTSGIKPENSFSALSPLAPTVGCFAPHSHPSPPEEKAASRKKSRLRRKKTAPDANNGASCVCIKGGMSPPVVDCHNRPSEALCSRFALSRSCASGFAFACMELPQYAISDGRFTASPPEEKAASRKNCGYYKRDWIVFVDQWVDCFFGSFP